MGFSFLFAVHNHQPVGNFEEVLERAFRVCYRPFLEKVKDHPYFRFCLHFSGPLWEYMEKKEKGCFSLVKGLVDSGQVELLGGGFYEPVLAVIPAHDRLGQLEMMNDYLEKNFGRRPRGIWLAERVWEPHLASTLARAGIEYTLLDEEHFRAAGIKDIHATYVTEDEGRFVRLLPIDKGLRYLIPFQSLDKVETELDGIRAAGGTAILGDDGEKFGLWPGTSDWVYKDGWLDGFLALIKKKDIRMVTCSEYIDGTAAADLVYIPPCSYEEMMEWVLEPDECNAFKKLKKVLSPENRRFIRGGFFRDFFRKYPEARALHNRMLFASSAVRTEGKAGIEALRELFRGQGNDPYWHGVFGGLYLPHLREAAYAALITAEEKADVPGAGWTARDLDGDGRDEVFSRGKTFNVFVKPDQGGAIFELDHLAARRNVTDILSRRPETYHHKSGEGEREGKSIHELKRNLPPEALPLLEYDDRPRFSAVDRFFTTGMVSVLTERLAASDLGDLACRPYLPDIVSKNVLELKAEGTLAMSKMTAARVSIIKTIENRPGFLSVRWDITFPAGCPDHFWFGSDWNFMAFPGELKMDQEGNRVSLYEGRLVIETSGTGTAAKAFPLKTLSQSEESFDIIHQGYCLCFLWPIGPFPEGGGTVLELKIRENE